MGNKWGSDERLVAAVDALAELMQRSGQDPADVVADLLGEYAERVDEETARIQRATRYVRAVTAAIEQAGTRHHGVAVLRSALEKITRLEAP
jgi:hypothetical protein